MDQNSVHVSLRTSGFAPSQSSSNVSPRRMRRFLLALTMLVCLQTIAPTLTQRLEAQTFAAAITGTVADQTGAAIPGAKVEIRNIGTSETRVLNSDAGGQFTANQLAPGQYSLTVTAEGFMTFVTSKITLDAVCPGLQRGLPVPDRN